jgi:ABC-type multidrug transport system ATPase subunit
MIKVQNLIKHFGNKRAVDGISFTVERGEVLGFLGPNGAGKSTTMRMITGFIPDSTWWKIRFPRKSSSVTSPKTPPPIRT